MGRVYTYSPEDVAVTVGPALITGFAEDSFISCEREEDSFTKTVGCDGTVTRTRNPNRSGSITITLSQSSPANDVLAAAAMKDEIDGSGVVPVMVKDSNGTTIVAGRGWVKKPANVEFGKAAGNREWVLDVDKMATFPGGASYQ